MFADSIPLLGQLVSPQTGKVRSSTHMDGLRCEARQRSQGRDPGLGKFLKEHPYNLVTTVLSAHAYTKSGRGKDAVTLLEKGAPDHQDDDRFQAVLGEAYLSVRDIDKAMEHFKNSLGTDADPMLLNNTAYALAEAKVKLDEAELYSKQAVMRLELSTREISADDARPSNFG